MIDYDYIECGDCIKLLKEIPDESIDLIVTDPPYLINYKTNHRKNKHHDFCTPIKNDTNKELISDFLKESYRVLKNNTAMYCFCSPKTIDFFLKECVGSGFVVKNQIVWVKNNWTAGDLKAQFGQKYEIILYLNKGRRFLEEKRISDVWEFPKVSGKLQLHQNQKPIDLISQCIRYSSCDGDIVLDPFMGVGTTPIACMNNRRHYIGFEIDQKYYDMACRRLDDAEGVTC